MSLAERLNDDMKQAMRDKDKVRLSVLRMVRSAVKNREIDLGIGATLSEEEVLGVVQKELKQRRDSLQAFESAGRTDLIDEVQAEISVLTGYLPEQMSPDALRALVESIIAEVNASSKADTGKVMGRLMPAIRGRADGKLAQQVVQELLP